MCMSPFHTGEAFSFFPSYISISSSTVLHLQLQIEMRNYLRLPEVKKDMMSSDGSHEGIAISSIYKEFISCPAQSTLIPLSYLKLTAMLLVRFYFITDLNVYVKTDSEK